MRILITLFVLFFSISINAEWVEIGKTDTGATNYIDFENIVEANNFIYVRDLRDEVNSLNDKYFSSSVLYQIDCTVPKAKTLNYVWFTKNMGNGTAIKEASTDKDWKHPDPTTAMFQILQLACLYMNK